MKDSFFKFPSTPHLTTLGGVEIRNDKVLSPAERHKFLQHTLIVEEKVDGANLGISFDMDGTILLQNRGAYLSLPGVGQWKKLKQWLDPRIDSFFDILADRYILFGEWCYAKHSIYYDSLPDWFLGFDLYDKKENKFLSISNRNSLFKQLSIVSVPFLGTGCFSLDDLKQFLFKSKVSDQISEGIYLRIDHGNWLQQRAKLVRSSFVQAVYEHWSKTSIEPNQLNLDSWWGGHKAHVDDQKAHDKAHVELNDTETKILQACQEPKSIPELLERLGYKSRTGNYKAALANLLDHGLIEMTLPESPRSKSQKYVLSENGARLLEGTGGAE